LILDATPTAIARTSERLMSDELDGTAGPQLWICAACGNHYPAAPSPPTVCVICADERQWVPPSGQQWATLDQLAADGHRSDVREIEPGLIGIGVEPPVGIGQRALLVTTAEGNLLWDPPGFLDAAAVRQVGDAGGLRAVSSSHPHFYGAITEWSRAFDAEILLPEADASWLAHPDPALRTWRDAHRVLPDLTLIQCGGHFPGSSVVHWASGAGGSGALLSGDTIFVTPGEDRVTFVWSAPNRLPLHADAVRGVVAAVRPYAFDRIYGGWWTPVLRRDAKRVVQASARRYIEVMGGAAARD
jgi:glyoxylase-like metal-dependent hydrolase (beta-lactamase superfamily II)